MGARDEAVSEYITTQQAADLLVCHPNTIRNWVRAGILTDTRVPGTPYMRLSRSEIEEAAEGRAMGRVRGNLRLRLKGLCHVLVEEGQMTPEATRQILGAVAAHEGS